MPDSTPARDRDRTTTAAEVVRSEERLIAGTETQVSGTVRVGKRVVTEERTVTVTVRREELYVEDSPGAGSSAAAGSLGARDTTEPVVTLTLSEEEPVVTTRVVPREVVRVYVDRTTSEVRMTEDVDREVVEADVDPAGERRG